MTLVLYVGIAAPPGPTKHFFLVAFYRNRDDDGTVNLNHLNNYVVMPTGRFCCVIPDAPSTEVTVCANIGSQSVMQQ